MCRQVHQAGGTGSFAAQPIVITGGEIQQASLRELVGAISKLSAPRGLFFQKRIVHLRSPDARNPLTLHELQFSSTGAFVCTTETHNKDGLPERQVAPDGEPFREPLSDLQVDGDRL